MSSAIEMKIQHDPIKKQVVGTVANTVQTDTITLRVINKKYPCGVLQLNGMLAQKKMQMILINNKKKVSFDRKTYVI